MRAGALPGGDAVCNGYHVWDEDECLRCGLIDRTYSAGSRPTERLVTICDCVEIIACWCDGITECPPCASSGNRPHVCATAEERAAHDPTDPGNQG